MILCKYPQEWGSNRVVSHWLLRKTQKKLNMKIRACRHMYATIDRRIKWKTTVDWSMCRDVGCQINTNTQKLCKMQKVRRVQTKITIEQQVGVESSHQLAGYQYTYQYHQHNNGSKPTNFHFLQMIPSILSTITANTLISNGRKEKKYRITWCN